jgi:hypothetical protein
VWQVRSSTELSYQIAYPVDWDVTHRAATSDTDACDLYFGPTAGEIQVYRYTDYPADASASLIFRGFADWLSSALGARIDTLDDVTVGGLQARVFRGHYTDDTANTLIFFQDAVIVGDGVTWEVQWYSAAGAEESDRLFMLDFLSTFQPGG